jgi:uncharacterized protein YbjQ (UPF0145 family)
MEVGMIVATTWNVAGSGYRVVETKGEVFGLVVRTRSLPFLYDALFRGFFGGEVKVFTDLLRDTRQQAVERMVEQTRQKGANAVLSMRFDASPSAIGGSEVVAYGTAAVIAVEK